jgi:predicted metalloendopeptidase
MMSALPSSSGKRVPTQGREGIDLNNLDRSVSSATDFDRFVNGGWYDRTPIPVGHPAFGSFGELRLANQQRFQEILAAALSADAPKGSAMQKLGDFYASGMDVERLNALGAAPLTPFLRRVDDISLSNPEGLEEAFGWLARHRVPTPRHSRCWEMMPILHVKTQRQ